MTLDKEEERNEVVARNFTYIANKTILGQKRLIQLILFLRKYVKSDIFTIFATGLCNTESYPLKNKRQYAFTKNANYIVDSKR